MPRIPSEKLESISPLAFRCAGFGLPMAAIIGSAALGLASGTASFPKALITAIASIVGNLSASDLERRWRNEAGSGSAHLDKALAEAIRRALTRLRKKDEKFNRWFALWDTRLKRAQSERELELLWGEGREAVIKPPPNDEQAWFASVEPTLLRWAAEERGFFRLLRTGPPLPLPTELRQRLQSNLWTALRREFTQLLQDSAPNKPWVAFVSHKLDRIEAQTSTTIEILSRLEQTVNERLPAFTAPAPPMALPKDLADFIGRVHEVSRLESLLRSDRSEILVGISGMPGVGKTALAVHVAHRVQDIYPDSQIKLDLRGDDSQFQLQGTDAMRQVLDRLSRPDRRRPTPEELEAAYMGALEGKRVLIIADNARDVAQIRGLKPPAGSALIVTARTRVHFDTLEAIELRVMSHEESDKLLTGMIGEGRATAAERGRLVELCGRLPLGLRAAGSFLRTHPEVTLAEYIQALRTRHSTLRYEDLDLPAALHLSVDRLQADDPDIASAWSCLSVFVGSFRLHAAAAVWDTDPIRTRLVLSELCSRSLLEFESDRYRMHDLYRVLATDLADLAELVSAGAKHASYYSEILEEAKSVYSQGALDGLRLFDCERAEIEGGQAWAAAHADSNDRAARSACRFALWATEVLNLRLDASDRLRWYRAARQGALRLSRRDWEGRALCGIGVALRHLGQLQEAIETTEKSLKIAERTGDRSTWRESLSSLGLAWMGLGEYRRALSYFERSLELARKLDDETNQGRMLGNLAIVLRRLGHARRAISCLDEQLEIARRMNDLVGQLNALGNLGTAWGDVGDIQRQVDYGKQALAIARKVGDRGAEAIGLNNIGLVWLDRSEPTRAIHFLEQSLKAACEIGDPYTRANALGNLATAWKLNGDLHKALAYCEEHLQVARFLRNRSMEGAVLGSMGQMFAQLDDVKRALQLYEQSLVIARETRDRPGEGMTLGNIGYLWGRLGKPGQAISYLVSELEICREIEDPRGEAEALWGLALARFELGEIRQCRADAYAALAIFERLGSTTAKAVSSFLEEVG